MPVNKVEYYGKVILDLTDDTVEESKVMEGVTFHAKDGSARSGNIKAYTGVTSATPESADITLPTSGKYVLTDIVIRALPAAEGVSF